VVDLKKQSQFVEGQMNVSVLQRKDYENRPRPGLRGNKASQSQTPAFGRKSEALSSKSEIMALNRTQFEKTKPISEGSDEH
jgi:hypothetical protein